MSIGERIRFIRNLRGLTQKQLGKFIGFPEKTADVRVAQYESGARTPKKDITQTIARVLDVSTTALEVPDTDTNVGIMHTLFALEDIKGLKIDKIDGELCLRLNHTGYAFIGMYDMFSAWYDEALKYRNGEIAKEEYDKWRYYYPLFDTSSHRRKILP